MRGRTRRLLLLPWVIYALVYFAGLAAVHQRYGLADVVGLRAGMGALMCWLLISILDRQAHRSKPGGWVLAVLATAGFSLAWIVIGNAVIDVLHPQAGATRPLQDYFSGATISIFVMLGWLALYFDDRSRTDANDAILAAERAKAAATDAQMRMLSARLNPHFLFNTLNSIRVLARQGRETETVQMIDRLSSLLRKSLEVEPWRKIPLQQELALAVDYLQIQKVRFHDRLNYRIDMQDDMDDACVPGQILQPLVENAVIHGMQGWTGAILVCVRAHSRDGVLILEVANTIADIAGANPPAYKDGFGLTNIRQRLHLYYPEQHRFDLRASGGNAIARMELPLETCTT